MNELEKNDGIFHSENWMYRKLLPDMGYEFFIQNNRLYIVNIPEETNLALYVSGYHYAEVGFEIIKNSIKAFSDEDYLLEQKAFSLKSFIDKTEEYEEFIKESFDVDEIRESIEFSGKKIDFMVGDKQYSMANTSRSEVKKMKLFLEESVFPEDFMSISEMEEVLEKHKNKKENEEKEQAKTVSDKSKLTFFEKIVLLIKKVFSIIIGFFIVVTILSLFIENDNQEEMKNELELFRNPK